MSEVNKTEDDVERIAFAPLTSNIGAEVLGVDLRQALSDAAVAQIRLALAENSIEDSQPIIKELVEFATQPEFTYRHRWSSGDAVFWDNRSVMHRACPFDEERSRRLMYRTTIKGDRPFLRV